MKSIGLLAFGSLLLCACGSGLEEGKGNNDPSTNSSLWTQVESGTKHALYGVANGDGIVAVGELGTTIESRDGETWTLRSSGTSATLKAVAYQNMNKPGFVAVGDGPTVLTSPNGGVWTTPDRFVPRAGCNSLSAVTRTNPGMIALGDCAFYDYYYGTNNDNYALDELNTNITGVTWLSDTFSSNEINMVFIATGVTESGSGVIYTADTYKYENWTNLLTVEGIRINGVAPLTNSTYNFVAVGASKDVAKVYFSDNKGKDWTDQPIGSGVLELRGVAYCSAQWFAVGRGSNGAVVAKSSDGWTWSYEELPATDLNGISCLNSKNDAIAVGSDGAVFLHTLE
jgi:hypothetical protein